MYPEDFRKAPFLRILFPLIGGIILGREWGNLPWMEVSCLLFSLGSLFSSILVFRGTMVPLLMIFFFTGIILGKEPETEDYPESWIKARICSEMKSTEYGKRTCIDNISYLDGISWKRVMGKASLQVRSDRELAALGKTILVRGKLNTFSPPRNPEQFDWGRFQRGKGILYQLYAEGDCLCTGEAERISLKIRSLRFRRALIEKLEEEISSSKQRAILNALLLGYRDELDPSIRRNFARSGTMHILAVSGLHVGILYLLPAWLLKRLKSNLPVRIGSHIILFVILWGYAYLTGLSSSVVRAVCMCCIYDMAKLTGRRLLSFHVLSLVAFIMIILRPHVVFEAGFQLSFAAVSGIILLYPRFLGLFPFRGLPGRRLAQMMAVSLAALLSTMPLTIMYFNQCAPGALLANLLVIPVATMILYGGLLFFLFAGTGIPASFPASILRLLSSGLERITGIVAELPGAYVEGLSLSASQVILLYLTAGLFILYLQRRNLRSVFGLLIALVLFLVVSGMRDIRIRRHAGIYVFALPHETAVGFVQGPNSALFRPDIGDSDSNDPDGLPYALEPFFRNRKLQPEIVCRQEIMELPFLRYREIDSPVMKADFFIYMDTRLTILRYWDNNYSDRLPCLETEILMLCNNTQINIPQIIKYFRPHRVVADNSNYASFCRRIASDCRSAGIPFSSTAMDACIKLE